MCPPHAPPSARTPWRTAALAKLGCPGVRKSLIYLHTAVGHNNIQHAVRYAACDRAVPELLEGLRVAARLLAILVVGGSLTGCSASSRVEDIVPSWANTPPRQAMPQHQRTEARKPDAKPQELTTAAKPQERTATAPQVTFEE